MLIAARLPVVTTHSHARLFNVAADFFA